MNTPPYADPYPELTTGAQHTGHPDEIALKAAARADVPFPEEADRRAAQLFDGAHAMIRMLWRLGWIDLRWLPERHDFAICMTATQAARHRIGS